MRPVAGFLARVTVAVFVVSAVSGPLCDPVYAQAKNRTPDKVLFSSNRMLQSGMNVFMINEDGSEIKNLTKREAVELDPEMSPDKGKVAFTVFDPLRLNLNLYVMNVDGTGRRALLELEKEVLAFAPSWSPAGDRIAFSRTDSSGDLSRCRMYLIHADGQGLHRLGSGNGVAPVWSPDGKQILYTVIRKRGNDFASDLYVMDADGTNSRPLIQGESAMLGRWSPRGDRITCMAGTKEKRGIYVAKGDGTGLKLVKLSQGTAFGPKWSVDGTRILYNVFPVQASAEIFVMDADGNNARPLTSGATDLLGGNAFFAAAGVQHGNPRPPGVLLKRAQGVGSSLPSATGKISTVLPCDDQKRPDMDKTDTRKQPSTLGPVAGDGFFAWADFASPKGGNGSTVLFALTLKDKKTGEYLYVASQQVSLEAGQGVQGAQVTLLISKPLPPGQYQLRADLKDVSDFWHPKAISQPVECTYTKK